MNCQIYSHMYAKKSNSVEIFRIRIAAKSITRKIKRIGELEFSNQSSKSRRTAVTLIAKRHFERSEMQFPATLDKI